MSLFFLHPHAGWLLLALPLFWWWSRGASAVRRGLRLAVLACVVLALTRPSALLSDGDAAQLIVVDQQAGLSVAQREQAAALTRTLLQRRPAALVLQRGGAPLALGLDEARHRVIDGAAAGSLSRSLEQALALMPGQGGAITVIGTAQAADSHWERVAETLRRREMVLSTLNLPTSTRAPFIVAAHAAPARAGEAVLMQVELEGGDGGSVGNGANGAREDREQVLSAVSEGRVLARSEPLRVQGRRTVALALPGLAQGFVPVRLQLTEAAASGGSASTRTPTSTPTPTDGFDTEIAVQPPRRLLYVQGAQQQGAARLQTLLGRGFQVEATTPAALAVGASALADRDLVMLDDVPATQMPDGLQQRLLDAVRDQGVGLFFSGGEQAFSDGRYGRTQLAPALPVKLEPRERNEQPSVALAIVVDTSGSMLGRPLQLAKQVARLAVRRLSANDSVGVVEFYGGRQWVAPMQPARHIPDVERAISRLQAQGATEMLYAALEEAYYGLKNTPARYKHLVVLSDGGVETDRYQQLIRHIAQEHVSVSAVLVGGDTSGEATMALWARLGQGRFYAVRDEFSTVELDFKQPQQKPEPGYHRSPVAVDADTRAPWWRDVAGTPPDLAGYASTTARPLAETWLSTRDGAPLLSSWQYGAGRVTALMTEPLGAGTQPWRAWPDYGQWLGRALGVTAASTPRVAVTLRRRFDQLTLEVRTNGERPRVKLIGGPPSVTGLPPLQAVAPGRFVADLPFPSTRTARVEASIGADLGRAVDMAESDQLPATRLSRVRADGLAQLVEDSRGVALTANGAGGTASVGGAGGAGGVDKAGPADAVVSDARLDELPTGRLGGEWLARALWPWLALLALVLYLIELITRRWPRGRLSA